mmetsp:Transcript_40920/g.102234  ORF Transcript_40920/g.102234 Transcript_40920/m.102234 type:complete len:421 (+) Transcript_40920:199-1461(+)
MQAMHLPGPMDPTLSPVRPSHIHVSMTTTSTILMVMALCDCVENPVEVHRGAVHAHEGLHHQTAERVGVETGLRAATEGHQVLDLHRVHVDAVHLALDELAGLQAVLLAGGVVNRTDNPPIHGLEFVVPLGELQRADLSVRVVLARGVGGVDGKPAQVGVTPLQPQGIQTRVVVGLFVDKQQGVLRIVQILVVESEEVLLRALVKVHQHHGIHVMDRRLTKLRLHLFIPRLEEEVSALCGGVHQQAVVPAQHVQQMHGPRRLSKGHVHYRHATRRQQAGELHLEPAVLVAGHRPAVLRDDQHPVALGPRGHQPVVCEVGGRGDQPVGMHQLPGEEPKHLQPGSHPRPPTWPLMLLLSSLSLDDSHVGVRLIAIFLFVVFLHADLAAPPLLIDHIHMLLIVTLGLLIGVCVLLRCLIRDAL